METLKNVQLSKYVLSRLYFHCTFGEFWPYICTISKYFDLNSAIFWIYMEYIFAQIPWIRNSFAHFYLLFSFLDTRHKNWEKLKTQYWQKRNKEPRDRRFVCASPSEFINFKALTTNFLNLFLNCGFSWKKLMTHTIFGSKSDDWLCAYIVNTLSIKYI